MGTRIRDIMITNPVTLRGEQSLFSARELMVIHEYECLFVVNDEAEPVGILTTVDINEDPKKKVVSTAMRTEFPRLNPDDDIQSAAQVFANSPDGGVLPHRLGQCRARSLCICHYRHQYAPCAGEPMSWTSSKTVFEPGQGAAVASTSAASISAQASDAI